MDRLCELTQACCTIHPMNVSQNYKIKPFRYQKDLKARSIKSRMAEDLIFFSSKSVSFFIP
ncbi:hypothetical protein AB751O23_AO_00190 [Chlamydiales bacterium SCGC AB-751-O23]|jgi:hypothetical protein|nr:hypothetical protein AB751O23_AO_00190 [Chlamydiales bacterium SCGC AB-751-O23]